MYLYSSEAHIISLIFVIQVDIQALAHAVELTRQGAIDGLRLTKGNLIQAFEVFKYFSFFPVL